MDTESTRTFAGREDVEAVAEHLVVANQEPHGVIRGSENRAAGAAFWRGPLPLITPAEDDEQTKGGGDGGREAGHSGLSFRNEKRTSQSRRPVTAATLRLPGDPRPALHGSSMNNAPI